LLYLAAKPMIKLSREIRFAIVPPDQLGRLDQNEQHPSDGIQAANSWAGWPSTNLIVPRLVLRCVVEGQPNSKTGYLCNIKRLDELLFQIVNLRLIPDCHELASSERAGGLMTAETMLRIVFEEAKTRWDSAGQIVSLTLAVTPYLSYSVYREAPQMLEMTEQFEFSAAHRLHCEEFSDEQNRELFGKCNNPEGHGHNYVVDITVVRDLESETSVAPFNYEEFESTVKRLVIDRLDHKHLNRDIEYFARVNPSVENISRAIFGWLEGRLGSASLRTVRVYETPKTWAEFSR
jgi:6-pyruvoyltetrahydropterin/6-carboxytetrahydropterin synthase